MAGLVGRAEGVFSEGFAAEHFARPLPLPEHRCEATHGVIGLVRPSGQRQLGSVGDWLRELLELVFEKLHSLNDIFGRSASRVDGEAELDACRCVALETLVASVSADQRQTILHLWIVRMMERVVPVRLRYPGPPAKERAYNEMVIMEVVATHDKHHNYQIKYIHAERRVRRTNNAPG